MNSSHIFISHASKDDDFVKQLRVALEGQGLSVWVDSRNLRGGAKLSPEITDAIKSAQQVVVVLSTNTINSPWVKREITKAIEVEKQRASEGYRVIPLLLPGVESSALTLWFDEEPVGVRVELRTGGVSEALPAILASLGERLPDDIRPLQTVAHHPVEELLLKLSDPKIETNDGKRRASATAMLVYEPADKSARAVESKRFIFTAPLGPIEADDLRWYLESYFLWPTGVFKDRAERIEVQLPNWGQDLHKAALTAQSTQLALNAWQDASDGTERCFSIFVDSDLWEGASQEDQATAREAASQLLSLPWELLHDGRSYLFQGKRAVRVRRRLPNRQPQPGTPTRLPIRILLVTPRPEDEHTTFIDHRISAKPLMDAVESLGELVTLTVLTPPTFSALQQALQQAAEASQPFDVVHFNGHGTYDREYGSGGLCFEDPKDTQKLENRAMQLIHTEQLAAVIRDHRIPLVFLEACQSAKAEFDPTASVAARMLEEGVTSVVAMSHSVLVESARRFVKAFYEELARGVRVGTAMLAGQRALHSETFRGKIMGAGELHLQDWFVPVLYQEEQDRQMITQLPPKEVQQLQAKQRRLSLGKLPASPPHHFQGRSRELLALERLLHSEPYAVVRGQGGAGKTTLVVEFSRWLVRVGRFRRAVFVSLEHYSDVRDVLISLGQQLSPDGDKWHVAPTDEIKQKLQPIERALADRPTVIVLDNLESILPDRSSQTPTTAGPVAELFTLCQSLLNADPATRLLFTSRESLPAPFDQRRREIVLGALSREDAIELIGQVMAQEGLTPHSDDPGSTPQEITDLVEAVHCHARALVLMAREISRRGVRATTENLHQLMAELHKKYPDNRENSLYASVELSLRRLPKETREQLGALGVFQGGANFGVLAHVLGVDIEAGLNLFKALIEVGLGEDMGYGHLRLDPALSPYLLGQISDAEQEKARSRWAEGMAGLAIFLSDHSLKDPKLTSNMTQLELSNLLAMLTWMQNHETPEQVVNLAICVETLLGHLGRSPALAQAAKVREQAAQKLEEGSQHRLMTEVASIDRLLMENDLQSAYVAAQQLLNRCLQAEKESDPETAYDTGIAHCTLGRVLRAGGDAETALQHLAEAQKRFQALTNAGDTEAEGMAYLTIIEIGTCLADLGRLDEAATALEEGIKRAEKRGDKAGVTGSKTNLGGVRFLQKRYTEALEIYTETRQIFEALGDPNGVAITWHQIGRITREIKQFEQAEHAFRQAVAIYVQQKDPSSEARSLNELGILYREMGHLEDAVNFYRQAADTCLRSHHLNTEGYSRSNLASALIELRRYDEARDELYRALECKKPYGHAAQPWRTWHILYDLEQAAGNSKAAAQARQQAIQSYMAYRRTGGASQSPGVMYYAVVAAGIKQGAGSQAERVFDKLLLAGNASSQATPAISKLKAILRGSRDPALADDPNLLFIDAVELQLLLEILRLDNALGSPGKTTEPVHFLPTPHPDANPEGAFKLNLQYQQDLAKWNALPWWKKLTSKKPVPPRT